MTQYYRTQKSHKTCSQSSQRKASFSRSFTTSSWLLSFATSTGVLLSVFCRVLETIKKKHLSSIEPFKKTVWNLIWDYFLLKLTLQRHSLREGLHTLSVRNQRHNAMECFCFCQLHWHLLQHPQELEHISPRKKINQ